MHDAELVSGMHDLAQPCEQRREHTRRHRAAPRDELVERHALDVLHRDPQHAVGLGAERIDVRGVRVVETRRELGLAQEPLDAIRRGRDLAAQDLDHCGATELHLLRTKHFARAALAEPLHDHEAA